MATAAEYARIRGRSEAWVSKQIGLGMPAAQKRVRGGVGYDIEPAAAFEWELERAKSGAKEPTAREWLAREQAEKFALENAKTRGELIDAGVVNQVLTSICSAVNTQFKTIQARCTHEFAGISDPQRIRERFGEEFSAASDSIASLLNGLADACEASADEAEAREAAAAEMAGSVGGREEDSSEGKRGTREVPEQPGALDRAPRKRGGGTKAKTRRRRHGSAERED